MKHLPISSHEFLSDEWHPKKNLPLSSDLISLGSGKKIWWVCSKKHEWQATPYDRANKGNGCPYCSGRFAISGVNDLETLYPEIAKEWHPSKNGTDTPAMFLPKANKKIWWLCDKNHEWQTVIPVRVKGSNCPFCAGRLPIKGINDLMTVNPSLSKEWHSSKNGTDTPEMFLPKANKKVWWMGSCTHEWEALISSRQSGSGCPICANQKVLVGYNDFATSHSSLLDEWNYEVNTILPTEIVSGNETIVHWVCRKEHHTWEASVKSRSMGATCPHCSGKRLTKDFIKEIPLLVSQWHPTKNTNLDLELLSTGSAKKVWWLCDKGHEWEALVVNRVKGNGCVYCSNRKILAPFNSLFVLYPEIAKEWDSIGNNLLPTEIGAGSSFKASWICSQGHKYKTRVSSRTKLGSGCPHCAGFSVLAGFNDLAASGHKVNKEWHPTKNLPLATSQVMVGSAKKVWWLCDKGHEWKIGINNRTKKNGSGCPVCSAGENVSLAEKEIAEHLKKFTKVEVSNVSILDGKEIDIYLPEANFAIEFNGVYWHSEEKGKDRNYHYNKWLACQEKGIQLVQIWEDDWNHNKERILLSLRTKLKINTGIKVFARKTNVIVLTTERAQQFFNANHIQGFASGSYYLGLVTKDTSILEAAIVLRKEPGTNGKVLNIIRYATKTNVVGGFTKLLAYATKAYSPESYITFSDHCISDGGLYKNNGFVAGKEIAPDYMYLVKGKRKHKFGYRLKRFKNDPGLLWEEGLTEKELAKLNKLPRIWDAGKTRWVLEV